MFVLFWLGLVSFPPIGISTAVVLRRFWPTTQFSIACLAASALIARSFAAISGIRFVDGNVNVGWALLCYLA
jgi:hypothetical protein